MKTYSPKPEHIERSWYVVDASDKVLGRLATEVAALLRGKHKPIFAPHMDVGDHVIVINADKVVLTGDKADKKLSHRHSGYPGGITSTRYSTLMVERPVFVVEKAIRGMLPKNRLGRAMFRKLHVVAGAEHPHEAQQPEPYAFGQVIPWTGLPKAEPKIAPRPTKASKDAAIPAEEAAADAKAAKKPAAKKTTAKKTTAKKPAAKKTTAKKPAAKKTTAKKPAAKKTTNAKPTSETDE